MLLDFATADPTPSDVLATSWRSPAGSGCDRTLDKLIGTELDLGAPRRAPPRWRPLGSDAGTWSPAPSQRGGLPADDVLGLLLPMFRTVQALHETGRVAPLRGLDALSSRDDR